MADVPVLGWLALDLLGLRLVPGEDRLVLMDDRDRYSPERVAGVVRCGPQ